MTTADNPYASPQIQPPPPPERPSMEASRAVPSIGKSFLKWTIACSLVAGPSFFFGSSLVHHTGLPAACGGMIAGIIVFIVLYVFVERTKRIQRMLDWQFARTTAWIGYGTRIAISIIFPIGMFPDILCGMLSVTVSQSIFGTGGMKIGNQIPISGEGNAMIFAEFFMTTVTQGVFLNVVLFGYMMLIFGICHLIASLTKPR